MGWGGGVGLTRLIRIQQTGDRGNAKANKGVGEVAEEGEDSILKQSAQGLVQGMCLTQVVSAARPRPYTMSFI